MATPAEIIAGLSAPFPVERLHFRVGATSGDKATAIALAYIDARDVVERLNDVVGPQNWQRRYPWSDGNRLYCEIGVRFGDEWIWKGDGAGETQVEADKGAFSDAFKRAGVSWGIGQYLYSCPNEWYPVEPRGRSYAFSRPTMQVIRSNVAQWQEKLFGSHDRLLVSVIAAIDGDDVFRFLELTRKNPPAWDGLFSKLNSHQKKKVRDMEQRAAKTVMDYVEQMTAAVEAQDLSGIQELRAELADAAQLKIAVWKELPENVKQHISAMKEAA